MTKPDGMGEPVPTIVEFLLDETASMNAHLGQTIAGFNEFLTEQKTLNSLCLFSLTKFSTEGLVTPYTDLDVNMVPSLGYNTFIPEGCTNLHDAIIMRLKSVDERLKTWDITPNVLIVVMTDGDDNSSKALKRDVKEKITQASQNGWTCLYLGADQNATLIAYCGKPGLFPTVTTYVSHRQSRLAGPAPPGTTLPGRDLEGQLRCPFQ